MQLSQIELFQWILHQTLEHHITVHVTQPKGHPGKFIETRVANHERSCTVVTPGPYGLAKIHSWNPLWRIVQLQPCSPVTSCILGRGYESFFVRTFRHLKSMQNRRDPSFFCTNTTALHQGDWLGQIAPASSMSLSDAWTSSSKDRGMCLKCSLKASSSLRQISCFNECWYSQAHQDRAQRCHGKRRVTPSLRQHMQEDNPLRPIEVQLIHQSFLATLVQTVQSLRCTLCTFNLFWWHFHWRYQHHWYSMCYMHILLEKDGTVSHVSHHYWNLLATSH